MGWTQIYGGTVGEGINYLTGYTGSGTQVAIVYPQVDTFDAYYLGYLVIATELPVGDSGGNREVCSKDFQLWFPAHVFTIDSGVSWTAYLSVPNSSQGYPHYVQLFVFEPS